MLPNTKGQTATFTTVKDHAIQKIQQTFTDGFDMADSLRDMKMKDLSTEQPVRKMSTETDTEQRKIQQDGFDVLCHTKLEQHVLVALKHLANRQTYHIKYHAYHLKL